MRTRKIIRRSFLTVLVLAILYLIHYCWISFPIISGYGAKVMGSAIFNAGRKESQVREQELSFSPMGIGSFTVDYKDSTVTGSVFGLARKKAVFRNGLGCTILNDSTEAALKAQKINLPIPPFEQVDSMAWPMGDRLADTLPSGVDMTNLKKVIENDFIEKDPNYPVRTRAIIVLYKGQMIAERYADGFNRNTRLIGWSMTKSIMSALVGILVREGKINIDAPAPVPEWKNDQDPRHAITIRNLLQQSSGLNFEENYTKSSDATRMLYQQSDMGAFTASHPLKDKPGTVFYYSSGNSNIISRIIRQTVGDSLYYIFPYQKLFSKIGIRSAIIEPDESGNFVGSSYSYATARDWARFGLFYLNDGISLGERILPEGWVKQSAEPASSAKKGQYGFQFWLNAGRDSIPPKYPHAPRDMYYADGFENQHVFVIPSKKMVIVRLGLTQHQNFDGDLFLNEILSAVQ